MDKIQTKKDEVILIIDKPEDLTKASGMFFHIGACKDWQESFVDEDTGEVVTIDRKEILYDRGTEITGDVYSSLLFHFQSGDIKRIEVSNQRRASYERVYGKQVYIAVAEIGQRDKKHKFLFSASSIPVSVEILKDYIELNFTGGYRIVSIKEFKTSIVLEDNLKDKQEIDAVDDDILNKDKFYQINAIITNKDGFEYNANVVVKTQELDKALVILSQYLKEKNDEEVTTKLEEAKLLTVDYIIEDEFVAAYVKNE
jgi:hypothetical protein